MCSRINGSGLAAGAHCDFHRRQSGSSTIIRSENASSGDGLPIRPCAMDERHATMSPDELRGAMRILGYRTQNDLAQAIGVSRSAVSLWLEGKAGVPRPVAMLLRMLIAAQRRPF